MNNTADDIIGQREKQAVSIKNIFLGDKQESLTDVLATIENFFLYSRTLVDFKMYDLTTYPLLLHRFSKIASVINNPRFKSLVEPHLQSIPWIPHQLIFFLQNYFEFITSVTTILQRCVKYRRKPGLPIPTFDLSRVFPTYQAFNHNSFSRQPKLQTKTTQSC